ncbi:hypothetical protein LYSHEL_04550 [Lysobacter helvus]|uniref:Secreted protein n=2 Tax=Lysobacteraceae TaxID=32033 RepID=A0ABM7Q2E6_9GAMM|nr:MULTISPECIES: hypothetical protein [Lysobacter]BCT91431.1 hypothetical protein LYSCAS_04550 [Lysobacter caseinilyticus]BCT94584.1 hypothetical protein LYSHEL_04550 [Lysobacter helvus]
MSRALIAVALFSLAGLAHAQSDNCAITARALPVQPTVLPAVAPEFTAPSHQLGAPTGVLAQAFDEAQSVDNVLLRLRLEGCRNVANAMPAASPGTPAANGVIDPATYKPKTQFDNTPWRFDMNQNGKRMTAEEFDQWMKARGVRVAKGGGAATAPAAPTPTDAAPGTTPTAAPSTTTTPATPKPPTKPDGAK